MPRPCENDHTPSPTTCAICAILIEPGERGDLFRKQFGTGNSAKTCSHRGQWTGKTARCSSCPRSPQLKVYECSLHPEGCVIDGTAPGVHTCDGGTTPVKAPVEAPLPSRRRWAYGVTTVPDRRNDLLPRTLASLTAAGFPMPRLFVDGDKDIISWEMQFSLPVTARSPRIGTAGNWVLSLYELYIREPACHLYALFQDDIVAVRNLKDYLSSLPLPERAYWNLYTFPENATLARGRSGWYPGNQKGKGAVALVFTREAVQALLSSRHLANRPTDPHRGRRAIDGGIVTAMNQAGFSELVHAPSLVQHTGDRSTMGNAEHPKADTFPGEHFNARGLVA